MPSSPVNASQLMSLRQAIRDHIPFCETFVSYDIVLLIMSADEGALNINIKAINALLPYSPSYMRQIFRDLERDGLIEISRDPRDKRNSVVKPSDRMRDAFRAFGRRAAEIFDGGQDGFDLRAALARVI